MPSSFEWDITPDEMIDDVLYTYERRLYAGVREIAKNLAPRIENWMKANAVWVDRTGNARQSLYTEVQDSLLEISILLSHGVEYGKWLEGASKDENNDLFLNANKTKYAILTPAIRFWAPLFYMEIKKLLNAL